MKSLLVLAIFLCNIAYRLCDDSVQDIFDVKPGGQTMVFEKEWKDYKCTFTYQAQGGTHEQWQVLMEVMDDGQYLQCSIGRDRTSYLYFADFSLSLTGPGVSVEDFEAVDTGTKLLGQGEVVLDTKTNTLSASKEGLFNNHLERIVLRASLGKNEL